MRASEAVDLISRTTFRPGWKFSATANTGGYSYLDYRPTPSGTIDLYVKWDTVDTSHPDDDGNYKVKLTMSYPAHVATINVEHLTENELLYRVLQEAHRLDEHEDREFLRVKQPDGTWKAPFHPHRADGDAAWYEAGLEGRRVYRRNLPV